jgi:hypothetical protein
LQNLNADLGQAAAAVTRLADVRQRISEIASERP